MALIKLRPRERNLLMIGLAIIVGAVLWRVAKGPWNDYMRLRKDLVTAERNLESALDYQEILHSSQSGASILENKEKERGRFDLYTYLNVQVASCGLQTRAMLNSQRPSGGLSSTKVTLNGVSVKELTYFLHKIYMPENLIVVQQMTLQPESNGKGLACNMLLVAPQ